MRYSRKCSSCWANAFIRSALTPWARAQPSRRAQRWRDACTHSWSSLHRKWQVQRSNSKYCRGWEIAQLSVNFKQRKYLHHLQPQCLELNDSMELWLGGLGTKHSPFTSIFLTPSQITHGMSFLILECFWGTSVWIFLLSFYHILRWKGSFRTLTK